MRRSYRFAAVLAAVALAATVAPYAGTALRGDPDRAVDAVAELGATAAVANGGRGATYEPDPEREVVVGEVGAADTRRDWSHLYGGTAAQRPRWASCRLTWAYRPRGGYPSAARHVRQALRRVALNSGYRFRRVRPGPAADLLIRWRGPAGDPRLAGSTLAYVKPRVVAGEIVRVLVTLDRTAPPWRGFRGADGRTWGTVVMHETGHALGLGHAVGKRQVLYRSVTSINGHWGAGDRTGLRVISRPCGP